MTFTANVLFQMLLAWWFAFWASGEIHHLHEALSVLLERLNLHIVGYSTDNSLYNVSTKQYRKYSSDGEIFLRPDFPKDCQFVHNMIPQIILPYSEWTFTTSKPRNMPSFPFDLARCLKIFQAFCTAVFTIQYAFPALSCSYFLYAESMRRQSPRTFDKARRALIIW